MALARVEAVQHEVLDVDLDASGPTIGHVHPRVSASLRGFSSLAYSLRAAVSRWAMVTAPPPPPRDTSDAPASAAARKAALTAMLRMFPPATLSCARRSGSRPRQGSVA